MATIEIALLQYLHAFLNLQCELRSLGLTLPMPFMRRIKLVGVCSCSPQLYLILCLFGQINTLKLRINIQQRPYSLVPNNNVGFEKQNMYAINMIFQNLID